jgi:hypothetical protein
MGLLRKIDGGWAGIATGHTYYAPRECEESAEAQERRYTKTLPFTMPKDVKPGSADEARLRLQEEALTNVERSDFQDTVLAYKEFCARNPEYVGTGAAGDANAEELSEFFAFEGKKFVRMNDAIVPLATSAEDWQRAYDWKLSMGKMRINQTAATAHKQEEARKAAQESVTREFNEDEDYSNLSLDQIAERARGQR